jgi:hypothetical protein
MPERTVTSEKKSAADVPNIFRFDSGKTHEMMTREDVLRRLANKEFIADQLKHIARAK